MLEIGYPSGGSLTIAFGYIGPEQSTADDSSVPEKFECPFGHGLCIQSGDCRFNEVRAAARAKPTAEAAPADVKPETEQPESQS